MLYYVFLQSVSKRIYVHFSENNLDIVTATVFNAVEEPLVEQ